MAETAQVQCGLKSSSPGWSGSARTEPAPNRTPSVSDALHLIGAEHLAFG